REPLARDLRQHIDACSDVLAALRVVSGGRRERVGGGYLARHVEGVKLGDRGTEAARVAADLVERHQTVVSVERRIFVSLGGDRAGRLLEPQDEIETLGTIALLRPSR